MSFAEAVAELAARFGSDMKKWRWGDLHIAEFKHSCRPTTRRGPCWISGRFRAAATGTRERDERTKVCAAKRRFVSRDTRPE